jgi:hypothetical protein
VTVHETGVLDASIVAALKLYDPAELPETFLITSVTLTRPGARVGGAEKESMALWVP